MMSGEGTDSQTSACCNNSAQEMSHVEEENLMDNDHSNIETEESSNIRFYPPAYIQRYNRVRQCLEMKLNESDDSRKAILEVGSAELSMHNHLKNLPKVEKIMYMDIDHDLLVRTKGKVRPLVFECLIRRETPLVVEVYSGCITKCDERILNCDPPLFAIVGIEILEHLNADTEVGFISTLFGKYAPPLIILTTPNGDFNTVLGIEHGKFRHWDHRFELTRQEFINWCSLVCDHFPKYKFRIEGIAEGPPGSEEYGCLSQMAIFEWKSKEELISQEQDQSITRGPLTLNPVFRIDRKDNQTLHILKTLNLIEKVNSDEKSINKTCNDSMPYQLIERIEYPWCVKPPVRQRVREEMEYHISHYTLSQSALEQYWENDVTTTSITVQFALQICQSMLRSKANEIDQVTLRNWLIEDGYHLEGEPDAEKIIISVPSYEEHSKQWYSSEEEEETDFTPAQDMTTTYSQEEHEEEW